MGRHYGNEIRDALLARGVKAKDLARMMGIKANTASVLLGQPDIKLSRLELVAKVTGVDLVEVLFPRLGEGLRASEAEAERLRGMVMKLHAELNVLREVQGLAERPMPEV